MTGLRPAVADGLAAARAELIKLVTLPALALTVVLTWAVTAGLALLPEPGETGIRYARAGFVAFGALAAASEYAGGQLRSSLLCLPRRLELQAVKVLVLALAVLPVAVVTVLLAGTGDVLPLALAALFASAVATLLRGAVPAVAVVLGYYYVLDPFVRFEPGPWLPAGALVAAAVVFARRDAGV
jgi:ABC-2 type transport system permease protein